MNELEISNFLSNADLVQKTIEQINKDFYRCGRAVQLLYSHEFSPQKELSTKIATELKKLNITELQQFIYAVDLQESIFLKAISQNDDYQSLAEKILEREALKVFIRNNYSH